MQFNTQPTDTTDPINRLDVFLWRPTDKIPMSTFSTVGMSDGMMTGCTHRCEIHWTLRGTITETEESDCASFLASVARYPFRHHTFLDYWHIIPNLALPVFTRCSNVLFHPAFTDKGWDKIEWNSFTVKILNMIPITHEENRLAIASGVNIMLDHLFNSQTDIFSDRK